MKLSLEQIRSVAHGVARVEQDGQSIGLFRFTKQQETLYKEKSWPSFYQRTFATAGVTLEFCTDSENLALSVEVSVGCGYRWFVHSVFVDDKRIGELAGFVPEGGSAAAEGKFTLGKGMKRVRIVFPWSEVSRIKCLVLDEGAQVIPIPKKRTMLIFGDSITQGYTTWLPENSYASQIARFLDADAVNKGIGGAGYWPELASTQDGFQPDMILVAYGANDWTSNTEAEFVENSKAFCMHLRQNYPKAKIFVLSPIWTSTREAKKHERWPFENLVAHSQTLPALVDNLVVIDGTDFVPYDQACFAEDRVHPNDVGFTYYARNLQKRLAEILDLE